MTAHKKLGALIVGAFVILALGSGAALAGQGNNKKHKSEPSYSHSSQTRYVSTTNGSYKHGKSYRKSRQVENRRDYRGGTSHSYRKQAYRNDGHVGHRHSSSQTTYNRGDGHWGHRHSSSRTTYNGGDGHWGHRHSSSQTTYNRGDGHSSHRHSTSQSVYDEDYGYKKRSKSTGVYQVGHGDNEQLVRLSSGKVVRVKLPENFDRSSISCYEKKHTGTDDGRKARISKTVCQDANGKTFAVAGSRRVIKYLN